VKSLDPVKQIFGEGVSADMGLVRHFFTKFVEESDELANRRYDRVMRSIGFVWRENERNEGHSHE
jgi:hypothetical protein